MQQSKYEQLREYLLMSDIILEEARNEHKKICPQCSKPNQICAVGNSYNIMMHDVTKTLDVLREYITPVAE